MSLSLHTQFAVNFYDISETQDKIFEIMTSKKFERILEELGTSQLVLLVAIIRLRDTKFHISFKFT